MSTYFPHDSLWIYTNVLPYEILELVGGKWDTFPLTHFKLYKKEEPICNKLSNGILAESNQIFWKVSLTSSLPSPLHILSKTTRFLMTVPSGHVLLRLWRNFLRYSLLSWCSQDILFPGYQHWPVGQKILIIPQETYCHTLVTKLVGEEAWLTS